MKEGWTYKKLGELCKITTGKRDANHAKEDGQYRFYTCASQYLMCDTYTFDGDCLILPGNGANVGDVYLYSGKFDAYQRTYVLSQLKEEVLHKYLYYYFLCTWRKQGTAKQYGAATNYIIMSNFTDFIVGYPSLSEQQSIVSRLDTAFANIDALKANAEKQLAEARKLFQAELTECMRTKEGWEEKTLGDVGLFSRGVNFAKSDFVKDGFPCIHYGQIHTTFGSVTYDHLTCIPKEIVRRDKLASKGNLIIAITSEDVEGSCKCTAWMGDYDIAVGAHAAIYKHQLNPVFVSYFFKSSIFQKEKEQYVHGFKVMEIKPSDIGKIPIAYPSEEGQRQIVARLDALSAHVRSLEEVQRKTLAECNALKQAMLKETFE